MAIQVSDTSKQKITVTIPATLLNRLDERISKRQRSEFIVQAIEARLALDEQVAVLDETAGTWTDENHPELLDGEAVEQWVSNMRNHWHTPIESHD